MGRKQKLKDRLEEVKRQRDILFIFYESVIKIFQALEEEKNEKVREFLLNQQIITVSFLLTKYIETKFDNFDINNDNVKEFVLDYNEKIALMSTELEKKIADITNNQTNKQLYG